MNAFMAASFSRKRVGEMGMWPSVTMRQTLWESADECKR